MNLQKNVDLYTKIKSILPFVFFWTLVIPFYRAKDIGYAEIAVLQTIGSVAEMILEIPLGYYSDRHGYRKTLLISSLAFIGGTSFLILGKTSLLLLISELFFALAMAAQSGADTALLYGSLEHLERTADYLKIRAKITQRQSVIRFFVRLSAPILFSYFPAIPFLLSLIPYLLVSYFTYQYVELPRSDAKTVEEQELPEARESKEREGSKVRRFFKSALTKTRDFFSLNLQFTLLSIFSMIILVVVSNYSQFFAPYLESIGIDIKFYGFVTASATLATFLGSRWITLWKKTPASLVLAICGGLICFLLAG